MADRRGLQGQHPVHRADCHPGVHEAGRGVSRQARPLVTAPARVGRRADQSRGMAVVPREHRQRPDARRRHLVADRDGHDHDHAAARRDDHQARLGDVPVPRRGRRRGRRERQVGAIRRRGLPRPDAAVAGDAARHLRRSRALQGNVLEPLPGQVLRRRRRQARRGRLPLAARPCRRRDERVRPPHLDDRGRVGAGRPSGRGRGRGRWPRRPD